MNMRTPMTWFTAVIALAAGPAAGVSGHPLDRWSTTWASAVQRPVAGNPTIGSNWSIDGFGHQSVRQVVRISGGGSRVRIRLSNAYGTRPLRVAGATIARTVQGARVQPGSVQALTFHGGRSTTIPAGHADASDGAMLPVSALEALTVTLYLADPTGPATFHEDGLTTAYVAPGDHRFDAGDAAYAGATSHSFYYLAGVDVAGADGGRTVVAFGDSITNGHNSTVGGNDRYTDALAERLAQAHRPRFVANSGISGNTLLNELPCFGAKGTDRFERDVLDQPGVRTVILLEGANDIWDSEGDFGNCGTTPRITAEQLIDGYRALIRAAHARHVRVIGATMTPFKAFYMAPADFARAEAIRVQVNAWIRTSGAYDAVVDFAAAVADPADPQQLNPVYNSGDSLHPNDAGYRAIAAAFNLDDL